MTQTKRTALIVGGGSDVASYNPQDYGLFCVVNVGITEVEHCDIWFTGIPTRNEKEFNIKESHGRIARTICRTSVEDTSVQKIHPTWHDKTIYVPKNEYALLRDKIGRPKKPTTGLVSIWYLMSRVDTVYITGFDSYKTPNRFVGYDRGEPPSHNFEKEATLISLWEKTMNLKRL